MPTPTEVGSLEMWDTLTHDVPLPGGTRGYLLMVSAVNGVPTFPSLPWGVTQTPGRSYAGATSIGPG